MSRKCLGGISEIKLLKLLTGMLLGLVMMDLEIFFKKTASFLKNQGLIFYELPKTKNRKGWDGLSCM